MITITVKNNSRGDTREFIIQGHAFAAEPGQDIVCAAVSVLSQTTILALNSLANIDIEYKIKDGYLQCKLPKDLSKEELYKATLLIDTMLLGLNNIQESYSEYIEIHYREV